METKNIGAFGELISAGMLLKDGFIISFPTTLTPYDCIIDYKGLLQKVQVKTSMKSTAPGSYTFNVHRTGYKREPTPYTKEEADAIVAVIWDEEYNIFQIYNIPIEEVLDILRLVLRPTLPSDQDTFDKYPFERFRTEWLR